MKPNMVSTAPLLLIVFFALPGYSSALSAEEEEAAFSAAGFTRKGGHWQACDDPTAGYVPGAIQEVRDLNGDGLPEVVITEGGTFCHGDTGVGYSLVSKQADGGWRVLTHGTGMLSVLPSRGVDGWPDLEIGGPGFCFPVESWNGADYVVQRYQYAGKPCRPEQ